MVQGGINCYRWPFCLSACLPHNWDFYKLMEIIWQNGQNVWYNNLYFHLWYRGGFNSKLVINVPIRTVSDSFGFKSLKVEWKASNTLVRFPNPLATGSDIHGSWGTWPPIHLPAFTRLTICRVIFVNCHFFSLGRELPHQPAQYILCTPTWQRWISSYL